MSATLRQCHGWRWRYHQPWLLVTGHEATLACLAPELTEQGYLLTEEAVLLWRAELDGQPDEAWLAELYRLRRRRPVDGVVLVVEDEEALSAPAHGLPAHGLALARIAHALRWSAPVYVLEAVKVDQPDEPPAPLAGCEFAPHVPALSLETQLLTLRDRPGQVSVRRLGQQPRDRYVAELSQRLDSRAAPLAAWLGGLQGRRVPVRGIFFAPLVGLAVRQGLWW